MINPYKEKLDVITMVQKLQDSDVIKVKQILSSFLEGNVDPILLTLALAPEDDEPLTEEEEQGNIFKTGRI